MDTDPYRNRRLDRVLERQKGAADVAPRTKSQRAPGLMIWAVTASNGLAQLIICDRGVKLNAVAYQKMLAPHFDWLRHTFTPQELSGALWARFPLRQFSSDRWSKREQNQSLFCSLLDDLSLENCLNGNHDYGSRTAPLVTAQTTPRPSSAPSSPTSATSSS